MESRMTPATLVLTLALLGQTPEVQSEQPSRAAGIALTASASAAMLVGTSVIICSLPSWLDGLDLLPNSTPGISSGDVTHIIVASALTAVGAALIVTGAVLLPMGIRRIRGASSESARRGVEVLPTFAFTGHAGVGGLLIRY
jgi:hypothetical protein